MKKTKRRISKRKYLFVFIFTLVIFVFGLILGWFIGYQFMLDFEEGQNELRAEVLGLELRGDLVKEYSVCELDYGSLVKERVELGKKLSKLEARVGKGNDEVLIQKEYYQLVELRTYLLLKEVNKMCGRDMKLILFFYTNKADDEKGSHLVSEDQGVVLDNVYKRHPDEVSTFSFDVNTDNPALNTLKEIYNITDVPAIVYDDEVYSGFIGLLKVEEIVGLE